MCVCDVESMSMAVLKIGSMKHTVFSFTYQMRNWDGLNYDKNIN